MLGGSAGQLAVGPLIHGPVTTQTFWVLSGVAVVLTALALVLITPRESIDSGKGNAMVEMLQTYKVVFSNPQSYLCGIVAGLLFAPTTVLDMIWGVRFLEQDRTLSYQSAVFASSMVPLGWVVGCPLMGWLADYWQRRKPVLFLGMAIMLACIFQVAFATSLVPEWVTLFVLGVGSGVAMIPYSIIKEVNPDKVKGSATGAMNFLTFSVTSVIGPIFASRFGKTLGTATDHIAHIRSSDLFWVGTIIIAILLTFALRETGAVGRSPIPGAKIA
jgi:MFS family permease